MERYVKSIIYRHLLPYSLVLGFFFFSALAMAKNREHRVGPGESIARIADFYGVGQRDLSDLNDLKVGESIRPGQILQIPDTMRGGASKGHVVKKGDTIASIARKHRVTRQQLWASNKMGPNDQLRIGRTLVIPDRSDERSAAKRPKKNRKLVRSGEKVKGGVRHTVQPGQSLWIIARAYNTTGEKIVRANGFETKSSLTAGQKILVPGAKSVVPVRVKGYTTQKVKFISVWNSKSASIRLLSKSGRVNQRSRKILSRLAGPKKKRVRRVRLLHPRLVHMLQRVAERFPGHTIEIVSGYRPHRKGRRKSKHSQGRAVDFRVQGVSRQELYQFVKELPRVGAGFYPNSVFVHMDVRDKKILWTDYSGVGEPAQMADPSSMAPAEAEAAADAEVGP